MKKKAYICDLSIPSINKMIDHGFEEIRDYGIEVGQILVEKTLDPWVVKELVTSTKIPIVPHRYRKYDFNYWSDTWWSFDSVEKYPDHFKFHDKIHREIIPPYPLYIMADIEKYGFIKTIAILKEAELKDVKKYVSTHQDIDQYSEELNKLSERGKENFEILFDKFIEAQTQISNQQKEYKALVKQCRKNRRYI